MLRAQYENWKLRHERQALLKAKSKALSGLTGEELQEAWAEWDATDGVQLSIIEARIKENISRSLLDRAEKLHIPMPGFGEQGKWVPQDEFDMAAHAGHWRVLTPEAFNELRAAIREEKRQRREVWEFWIKVEGIIITALTGLVGAAIGLVSILKK